MTNNKKNIIILIILIIITILLLYYKYANFNNVDIEHFNNTERIDVFLMLGVKKNDIINYFDNFINFDLIKSPIKKLRENTWNGFFYKLEYIKDNNISNIVLKSTVDDDSDNLIYEYVVGLFLNKQLSIFPCFIETYGLYTYKNKEYWEKNKNSNELDITMLKNSLNIIPNEDLVNKGCEKYTAILLQCVDNAITLKDSIQNKDIVNYELLNILFQIYLPLSTLSDIFIHDDLHCKNVILYKPYNNKYIKYHYHLISGINIVFKSQYIAKIIDYGNSYFIDGNNGNNGTEKFYKKICISGGCEQDCYKYSINKDYKRKLLRDYLMREIILDIEKNNENNENNEIKELLKNIQCNENINVICENLINSFIYDDNLNDINNNYFKKYEKMGDLYIFQDGQKMKYVEK